MTDIVERLRNQLEYWNSGGRFEAADEIERLRAALNAASFYINASEQELADAGMTRADALMKFHELHGPVYLANEQTTK